MPQQENPLRAVFYADRATVQRAMVAENVAIARNTFRVRVRCGPIASAIQPGQFVMLRLAATDDPLVGRALAVYDTYGSPDEEHEGLDLVYQVVGKLTSRLAKVLPGTPLDVWGPLGNGFPAVDTDHLILVAGGIGQTPFLAVAKAWLAKKRYGLGDPQSGRARRVTLCYGTRSREFIACVDDYLAAGAAVRICTDDGTNGRPGYVTDDLRELLELEADSSAGRQHIFCCGPEPMMEATAKVAATHGVPCHVSLETPMACGVGICFSCVTRVRDGANAWDYKRTCVDGPIFAADQLAW